MSTPAANKNIARQAAAAAVFSSYFLGPFIEQKDHWSIFRGWTLCAAAIAHAGEGSDNGKNSWEEPFDVAHDAAFSALKDLIAEAQNDEAWKCPGIELDVYTQVRNTVTAAAVACGFLAGEALGQSISESLCHVDRIDQLATEGRLCFWGEGALSQHILIVWFLERHGRTATARKLLHDLLVEVVRKSQQGATDPLADPYVGPDESLLRTLTETEENETKQAVESRVLYPLVTLMVRREMRTELEKIWPDLTRVLVTWFLAETPVQVLRWHCDDGREITVHFDSPQSWKDLQEICTRQDSHRLPAVLWEKPSFALFFILTYQHRMLTSLYKRLDEQLKKSRPIH